MLETHRGSVSSVTDSLGVSSLRNWWHASVLFRPPLWHVSCFLLIRIAIMYCNLSHVSVKNYSFLLSFFHYFFVLQAVCSFLLARYFCAGVQQSCITGSSSYPTTSQCITRIVGWWHRRHFMWRTPFSFYFRWVGCVGDPCSLSYLCNWLHWCQFTP